MDHPSVRVTIETRSREASSSTTREMVETEPTIRLPEHHLLGICVASAVAGCRVANPLEILARAIDFVVDIYPEEVDILPDEAKPLAEAMIESVYTFLDTMGPTRADIAKHKQG